MKHEWNDVCEPFIRRRSRLSFGFPSDPKTFTRSHEHFLDTFKHSKTQIPFTAIGLKEFPDNNAPWPTPALEAFLNSWKTDLKDLSIDNIEVGGPFKCSDIFKCMNLTKLTITSYCGWSTDLQVSLDSIPLIKYLNLYGCGLGFPNGTLISPVEIELRKCKYNFESGNPDSALNEFIDFKNVKKCVVHNKEFESAIDLKGSFEVETLDLDFTKVLNWKTTSWKIGTLSLKAVQIEDAATTSVQVKHMVVQQCWSTLFAIPTSVETLTVEQWLLDNIIFCPNMLFPKLHSLRATPPVLKTLSKQCPKLISLQVIPDTAYEGKLSTAWIPKTVTNLKINTRIHVVGEDVRELEKLVLNQVENEQFGKILKSFSPRQFVYNLNPALTSLQKYFPSHKEYLAFLEGPYETIAIGQMDWNEISKYQYHLFKNGNPIQKVEFDKMMDL